MSLSDEISAERNGESRLLRRERDQAVHRAAELQRQLEAAQRALTVIEKTETLEISPPKWLSPAKPKPKAATVVAMLSDTHFDEVVLPEEVDYLNCYNREIAVMRLEAWAKGLVKMARHYLAGLSYDGCVLILGGDIFSGDIHEELAQTNEDTMIGSLLFWSEQLCAATNLLAEEFGKVHITAVVGNHGRTSRKPRMKLRAKTNFDWLLAKMMERHFQNDKRVSFLIPEGADAFFNIYGHGQLVTHGDQATGGSGIGGIYPPIMRLRARKAQRYLATGQNFTTLWMGHWHQYLPSPGLIVNGSLKGLDEYAFINNFGHEVPQQAMAIVTPEHGITVQAPIFCLDRKKEKW
jgi:hypothetical protein